MHQNKSVIVDRRSFDHHLDDLVEASHHGVSPGELFGTFSTVIGAAFSADLLQLLEYMQHEAAFVLRAGQGFPENLYDGQARVPAGLLSQAGRALLDPTGRPVALEDFSRPHDWVDDDLATGYGAKSGLAIKIRNEVEDFGALAIFYRSPRRFTDMDRRFLSCAATLLGAGLERLAREASAVAWRSRAKLLSAGTALLKVPAQRDAVLSAAALSAVSSGVRGSRPIADWCFADALEADGFLPKLRRVAVDHADGTPERLEEAFSAPLAPGASYGAPRVYVTRQPELVERTGAAFISGVASDPEHRRAVEEVRPYSYVCVPVLGRERFHGALGFLRVETGTPVPYDHGDLAACAEFAALVGAAIDAGLPRSDTEEARDAIREYTHRVDYVSTAPTVREREVLELIAAGNRLTDIGSHLHIDYQTVRTHKRHLCQRLGISTKSPTVALVAEARGRGWLET